MAIQRLEEVPAICENSSCSYAHSFELYDTDTVKRDSIGDYVKCYGCKWKIYLDAKKDGIIKKSKS